MEEHWVAITKCTLSAPAERTLARNILQRYKPDYILFALEHGDDFRFNRISGNWNRYWIEAKFSTKDAIEYKLRFG